MSVTTAADAGPPTGLRLSTERLRGALLWLFAFSGAFVFIEPGPYELIGAATIFFFAVTGLTLRPALGPLVLLIILLNIGYAISVVQVVDRTGTVIWVLVSVFLTATTVFFAGMLGTNTEQRLRWVMRGYLAAAVIASILAIGAYFRLFGGLSDLLLLFGRAKSTFKDPNVFGAFLVLPGLLLLQRILAGRRSEMLGGGLLLLVLMGGLLLSFSRAAWGQFLFCALLLMGMTYITSRSRRERFRIVLVAIAGMLLGALFIAALLSIDQVADLFRERATLSQTHDTGHLGRFGRYILGAQLVLEQPFGVGPLQFSRYFPEDPHNAYLNSFVSGGWLGGFAYLAITLMTLTAGFRFVFVVTPWRPAYLAIYAAYVGLVVESAIIDSDHWRHYFLTLGVLWGLIAVSRPYLVAARAGIRLEEPALAHVR
jgi:O-Antigen ligase